MKCRPVGHSPRASALGGRWRLGGPGGGPDAAPLLAPESVIFVRKLLDDSSGDQSYTSDPVPLPTVMLPSPKPAEASGDAVGSEEATAAHPDSQGHPCRAARGTPGAALNARRSGASALGLGGLGALSQSRRRGHEEEDQC